jgi:glycosyltransferase involved in cell wall biosynthesis
MADRGVARDRIRVQHMPIRPLSIPAEDAAVLRNELGIKPNAPVVLTIGRQSKEKGQKDLVSAFAQLANSSKDIRLVLVGDGPEMPTLRQQVQNLGISESVLFCGHRDDAKRFYSIATLFALPSYTEGTPNVLLESMSAKVPIVTTSVGGIPELAVDGHNALLVPAGNPPELAKAMLRVLEDTILRNKLTQSGQEVVASHSPRGYFEGMRKVFVEAVSK